MRATVFILIGPMCAWVSAACISFFLHIIFGNVHFLGMASKDIMEDVLDYRDGGFLNSLILFYIYGIFSSMLTYYLLRTYSCKSIYKIALIGSFCSVIMVGTLVHITYSNVHKDYYFISYSLYNFLMLQALFGYFGTLATWYIVRKITKGPAE
jgi:hypothetical protein